MFSAATFWITAVLCLLVGAVGGWLAGRTMAPGEQQRQQLEKDLELSRAELLAFRSDVTEHFKGTADKINRLTEDYRDLHQHLATGALGLCEATGRDDVPMLNSLGSGNVDAVHTSQPLDYAPRRAPDEPGILNEGYDLDRLRP